MRSLCLKKAWQHCRGGKETVASHEVLTVESRAPIGSNQIEFFISSIRANIR
jgi:hypothetical protein